MSTKIGPQIGIDGYKEYRDNMARILAQLAALDAQTKALDATYKGQTNSLEYLTKKEKLQAEALKLQTEATRQSTEWTNKVTQALAKKENATTRDAANAAKTVAANERVNASYAQTEAALRETQQAIENYGQGTAEVIENSERAASGVGVFTVAVGNLVSRLIQAGAEAGKQFLEMGVGFNAQIEKYTAAFSTLYGSEKAAEGIIARIQQVIKRAPVFSTESFTKSVQAIAATGREAEKSVEDIEYLANAVAASGGGNDELERMAQNLQQIGNAGKATSMDIRQFAYAGIPLLNLIAEATGRTVEEVSQLETTYDDIINALKYAASEQGRFYGGLEKQADTLNGQWSRFKNNLQIKAGDVFSGFTDFLRETLLPLGNAVLESEKLGENIGYIGSAAATLIVASQFNKITTAIQAATTAVKAFNAASLATAGGWGALAGVVAATVGQTIKFNKAAKNLATERLENIDLTNLEAVKAALNEINPQIAEYQKTLANMGDGGTLAFNDSTDYSALITQRQELLAAQADLIKQQEELAAYEQSEEGQYEAYISNVKNELQQLHDTAQQVYDAAYEAAQTEFGIFEAVAQLAYTSTTDLQANLQSQTDFWNQYAANLAMLSDTETGLSKELLSVLSDGSQESAAFLNSIVQDVQAAGGLAAEGGQQIIQGLNESWGAVAEAQQAYALQTEETLVGAAQRTVEIMEKVPQALEAFNVPQEMRAAAVNDINAFKNGLWGQAGSLNSTASSIGSAAGRSLTNAFAAAVRGTLRINGTGSITFTAAGEYKDGLDYVPYDEFPAILHEGERVLTKAENRAYTAGLNPNGGSNTTVNYYLTAQTIDNETLDYITAYVDRQLGGMV